MAVALRARKFVSGARRSSRRLCAGRGERWPHGGPAALAEASLSESAAGTYRGLPSPSCSQCSERGLKNRSGPNILLVLPDLLGAPHERLPEKSYGVPSQMMGKSMYSSCPKCHLIGGSNLPYGYKLRCDFMVLTPARHRTQLLRAYIRKGPRRPCPRKRSDPSRATLAAGGRSLRGSGNPAGPADLGLDRALEGDIGQDAGLRSLHQRTRDGQIRSGATLMETRGHTQGLHRESRQTSAAGDSRAIPAALIVHWRAVPHPRFPQGIRRAEARTLTRGDVRPLCLA